ncbi:MAG: hypothetical protein ACRYF0_09040 [Janthinobacterium lividum]
MLGLALLALVLHLAADLIFPQWLAASFAPTLPVIAILKSISDRIESLRTWDQLLGDEKATDKRRGRRPNTSTNV